MKTNITGRLEKKDKAQLIKIANKANISLSQLITNIVERYLNETNFDLLETRLNEINIEKEIMTNSILKFRDFIDRFIDKEL